MYLPTSLPTILKVMASKAQATSNFWAGPIMADADPDVRRDAVVAYQERASLLLELARDIPTD